MRALSTIACLLLVCGIDFSVARQSTPTDSQPGSAEASGQPADAQKVRAEIRAVEDVLPKVPDRGAALFLLARRYAQLGELQKALALLKECVALDAGFDPEPAQSPSLRPLASNTEFRVMLEQVRRRYPPVHKASVAFTVPAKDLFPEGLAVDTQRQLFYMGSMHHGKIVKFALDGSVSDFVKQDLYDLMPIGGVHVEPADHSLWASTDAGKKHHPELLHFDAQGKLLERYASPGTMPYDLNDLVLRGSREIFTTDTEGHHVYRFDRASHSFTDIKLYRPVFYPNGITLSGDGNLLFVADMLGVIRVDLLTNESEDVDPGVHNTLSGIDGLYWNKGEFLGVQYGTGSYRVMRWQLSPGGRKVTASEILEHRTDLVSDPTTGAVLGDNFYFIANTGIYNLEDDKIVDPAKLEPVHIAVVAVK
jgi:sugar lactone lactonase YvrE